MTQSPEKIAVRLHNSLTRKKEAFLPIDPSHIRMYLCGPTVYDRAHLGNARSAVVFDQLFRVLNKIYPRVTYVRNITDIDDKINAAALAQGVPIADITQMTTTWYQDDMAQLGAMTPTHEPRATHHIPEMILMISRLIDKGYAYAANNHVLFRVRSFADYGKLSGRNQDEMLAGARVEVAPYKEDPFDFVLWKPSDENTPGWDSPWGVGRPGWHIECSAMSEKLLGFPFDIHAGGHDLIFPHHENEIAQGECATGHTCANYWMHNGFLTIDGQKMSKSLGNFITTDTILQNYAGEVIRYALLSAHYRQSLDWNAQLITQSQQSLDRFYTVLQRAGDVPPLAAHVTPSVLHSLADDLNTPQAFAQLHDCANKLNREWNDHLFADFYVSAQLLGLFNHTAASWFKGVRRGITTQEDTSWIEFEIENRQKAKKSKDFSLSDTIRQNLLDQGIVLEDHRDGTTTWKRR